MWPSSGRFCHTLIFEGDRRIDVRCVCPKDVKKLLLLQARTVCWKKWAAEHEYEELKGSIWLEPPLALLRKKTKEDWTEKHRNVAKKGFWKEVGCRRNSSTLVCQMNVNIKLVTRRKAQKSRGLYHCPGWNEVRRQIPEACTKWEQKARASKKGVEVAMRHGHASSQ